MSADGTLEDLKGQGEGVKSSTEQQGNRGWSPEVSQSLGGKRVSGLQVQE